MSLAAAFASALYLATPPILHSTPGECVPVWFHPSKNIVRCADGFEIHLWGIVPVVGISNIPALDTKELAFAFRASAAVIGTNGVVELRDAKPMRCYSPDSGDTRVGQCFATSDHVFGPEDIACELIKLGLAKPSDFARDYYSMCLRRRGTTERG